jgi:hypothetical protein
MMSKVGSTVRADGFNLLGATVLAKSGSWLITREGALGNPFLLSQASHFVYLGESPFIYGKQCQ